MCYECEKTDHSVKNCRNKNVMFRRQLNITLKKVFEIDNKNNTVNKTEILKIRSKDEYCMISSTTKLQKVIDAASNKIK